MGGPQPEAPVESLVAAWQAGEGGEELFRQLFDRYFWPLDRLFARRGFSREERQDLIQETFLEVHRGLAGFRGEAAFDHWIFAIASNVGHRALRSRKAHKRDAIELPLEEQAGGDVPCPIAAEAAESPLRRTLERERTRLLHEAVGRLPSRMRQCVRLRLVQDLHYAEIAELLQVAEATVKVQLFKARQRLREELGEYYDERLL